MNGSATNKDWFVHSQTPRLERLEAYFGGHAYDPHRHDTYAVGITLAGVQSFHYRGVTGTACPGARSSFIRMKSTMVTLARPVAFVIA